MSVLINRMHMPRSCKECPFTSYRDSSLGIIVDCVLGAGSVIGYKTGDYTKTRHPNCPLIDFEELKGEKHET